MTDQQGPEESPEPPSQPGTPRSASRHRGRRGPGDPTTTGSIPLVRTDPDLPDPTVDYRRPDRSKNPYLEIRYADPALPELSVRKGFTTPEQHQHEQERAEQERTEQASASAARGAQPSTSAPAGFEPPASFDPPAPSTESRDPQSPPASPPVASVPPVAPVSPVVPLPSAAPPTAPQTPAMPPKSPAPKSPVTQAPPPRPRISTAPVPAGFEPQALRTPTSPQARPFAEPQSAAGYEPPSPPAPRLVTGDLPRPGAEERPRPSTGERKRPSPMRSGPLPGPFGYVETRTEAEVYEALTMANPVLDGPASDEPDADVPEIPRAATPPRAEAPRPERSRSEKARSEEPSRENPRPEVPRSAGAADESAAPGESAASDTPPSRNKPVFPDKTSTGGHAVVTASSAPAVDSVESATERISNTRAASPADITPTVRESVFVPPESVITTGPQTRFDILESNDPLSHDDVSGPDENGEAPAGMPARPHKNRKALIAVLAIAAVLLLVGIVGLNAIGVFDSRKDFDSTTGGEAALVEIPEESTLRDFGRILADAGVVGSQHAFVEAAGDRALSAGFYSLPKGISGATAVTMIEDEERSHRVGRLVIPEGQQLDSKKGVDGKTKEGLFAALADATSIEADGKTYGVTVEQLQEAAATASISELGVPDWAKAPVERLSGDHRRIEGLIASGAWEDIDPRLDAKELLHSLITRSVARFETWGLLSANSSGLMPYDALVVASVVEAEVSHENDYAKVARVILNRLDRDQKLQMDSTVNYTAEITDIDVRGDAYKDKNEWNTYQRDGLPATPIGAVGERAMEAVESPAEGNWLYFVTVDTKGTTLFARTFAKHKANRQVACRNKLVVTGCS
ncbi:MAG: endolytic transglycosylase MltG [Gordonia sp. (in: high G+C Gram-positive bacteria)]|uniref:endolytic transglycosylase MltG n=1 Tax=Gordonia sp. (in: high G+C Gram-positive bacteria) TaxID=84139 RepID=UPI0039E59F9F